MSIGMRGTDMKEYNKTEIDKALMRMEKVFGEKYGIANEKSVSNFEHSIYRDDASTYSLANTIPMYRSYVGNSNFDVWKGSGSSLSRKKSMLKAYGEFIERYCAYAIDGKHDEKIIFESYEKLKNQHKCLNINDLIDFDERIYKSKYNYYGKYSDESKTGWVLGNNIITDEKIYIPAQKVFLGTKLMENEKMYIQWLSTGLACGSTYKDAIISAIYELVERDSFMLTWQLELEAEEIIMDRINNLELKKLYNHISSFLNGDDKLYIYDISRTEGIYTVITFIQNYNPSSFGLITSASSDVDIEKALLKSLEELCLTQSFSYNLLMENDEKPSKEEVIDLDMHLQYYNSGDRAKNIDFIKSNKSKKLSDLKKHIDGNRDEVYKYIVNLFKNEGKEIFIADVTKDNIRECGLHVVRAIIKGYNDLEISHSHRLINNKRLKKFQAKYKKSINENPHPFP